MLSNPGDDHYKELWIVLIFPAIRHFDVTRAWSRTQLSLQLSQLTQPESLQGTLGCPDANCEHGAVHAIWLGRRDGHQDVANSHSMVFEAGERMVLTIAGLGMVLAEFEPLRGAFTAENNGTHYCVHLICTGIATDSEV